MKTSVMFLISFLAIASNSNMAGSLSKKFPHNLHTDDYEILNENDILYDITQSGLDLKDLKNPQLKFYQWQCFPIASISFNYDTWKDRNPYGGFDIINLCDFEIKAVQFSVTHFYYDRRARPLTFCRIMHKNWKKITANQTHLCLNGEPSLAENKRKHWVWNKAKTKIGCISLFEGECKTSK